MKRRLSRSFLATFSFVAAFFFVLVSFILIPEPFESDRLVAWHFGLFSFLVFQPLIYLTISEALCRQAADLYKFRFSLKTGETPLYDRILTVAMIALTGLVPLFQLDQIETRIIIISVVAWIAVTEILLVISGKLARADFQHDIILVRGVNFRKHYGLNSKAMTTNGIYLYEEFESYSLQGALLTLKLKGLGGRLRLRLPKDLEEPVCAYLEQAKLIRRV
ncbi:hypothetical protein [Acidaminobacter hydrogenoformans]|uniref:Uncharacterized protein n=1 Tax=Acidaminobacter hydrogenoformans DSM 2784 TaxID=1120920 RepID=A0A1G5S4S4_9FIRM|nr:hypothetical protein [Acidaminobacter hydrogenoformans]SCZ80751.1 hypothetical protein SAMN03080599_02427 [Acidaminobacter hydrogenoformans DSM 2784]